MEINRDVIETYTEDLIMPTGHLNPAKISIYINFYTTLSDREKSSVDSHLEGCQECQNLYARVFDDEMEFDPGAEDLEMKAGADGMFSGPGWSIKVSTSGKETRILFQTIPDRLVGQKARLAVGSGIVRVVSLTRGLEVTTAKISSPERLSVRTVPAETKKSSMVFLHLPMIRYLAAAVVLGLLGFTLYSYFQKSSVPKVTQEQSSEKNVQKSAPESPVPADKDTLEKPAMRLTPGTLAADRYATHDILESFIDRQYRSEKAAEPVSPDNGIRQNPPIQFKWKSSRADLPVTISVVDNQNTEVWSASTTANSVQLKEALKPGLYYWLIKSDGETLAVRKFTVR